MAKSYDAIVIGAGIIGTSVSFELAKLGWKTLNLDKLPAAGYGSTGASCAVIRVHYSTLDGTALAFEGYHYWKNWKQYLEIDNDSELARFVECGCMVYQTPQNNFLQAILEHADQLAIPYERWDPTEIKKRMPIVRTASFSPAKSMKDPTFGNRIQQKYTEQFISLQQGISTIRNYLHKMFRAQQKAKEPTIDLTKLSST